MSQNSFNAEESNEMLEAYQKAQQTFKYFWREVYWDFRRIIPALDLAIVKVKFEENSIVEHMWIEEIYFDGTNVIGVLANSPNTIKNIAQADDVSIPLSNISDWLYVINGISYGGFTIQLMRSQMEKEERQSHDDAWGVDFGDFDNILLAYDQEEHPENLEEHPMSINMGEQLREFLKSSPEQATNKDEKGYTLLHLEALAGSKTCIEIMIELGIDTKVKTNSGETALDLAKKMNWEHLIPLLS